MLAARATTAIETFIGAHLDGIWPDELRLSIVPQDLLVGVLEAQVVRDIIHSIRNKMLLGKEVKTILFDIRSNLIPFERFVLAQAGLRSGDQEHLEAAVAVLAEGVAGSTVLKRAIYSTQMMRDNIHMYMSSHILRYGDPFHLIEITNRVIASEKKNLAPVEEYVKQYSQVFGVQAASDLTHFAIAPQGVMF